MKKLIALISPEGKTKEQLTNEMHAAVQKYFKVEKEVLANTLKKKNKKPDIYMAGIIILILTGYLYFSNTDKEQVIEENQQANTSIPVSPEELEELKKDPLAPAWLKDAESCTWVGEKIFCKLYGE